ncbi:hypothetical protein Poli38472_014822 [Pythium oligandrum]|uniref:Uncharacterized protein n=1 Tax=Pythium oligandrum TaxID=41045 RepID=A0A8K1CKI2_PYTOL|nr:hypothetical protein Poli38472_014822 [Pythium oligandrum]|eukprot:TMW63912.1 hypothetical protein Poli38472_014822 [Pythium oligandrum]
MCWSLADSFEADLCNAFTATSALVVEDARTETNADADDDERTVSQSDSASPSSRSLPPSLLFPEGGLELADDAEDYRGHGDQWVPSSDAWTAYLIESDEDYQADAS